MIRRTTEEDPSALEEVALSEVVGPEVLVEEEEEEFAAGLVGAQGKAQKQDHLGKQEGHHRDKVEEEAEHQVVAPEDEEEHTQKERQEAAEAEVLVLVQ